MKLTGTQEVVASVLAYSFCSGTLVLLNKLILHYLPFPSLIVAFQFLACLVLIYGAQCLGKITVDPIKWEYVKPFLLYVFFFSTGAYFNMRSLSIANVETTIVFRALTPTIVAFLDAIFLGREWPSVRSWIGLGTLIVGAYSYASYDEKFQNQGYGAYFWPSLYTIAIALEMACGKQVVRSVPLKTISGPVVYTNLLSFIPMLMMATVGNEYAKVWDFLWKSDDSHIPLAGILLLGLGCLVGAGIGYSGWWCRRVVSATSFTLIGVLNKCLTVLLNLLIWDQHAKPGGIASLMICIAGGIIYQQAPMKADMTSVSNLSAEDDAFKSDASVDSIETADEEQVKLLEMQSTASKRRG